MFTLLNNSLMIGLLIGACVGFVIAMFLCAAYNVGKGDYAKKHNGQKD